MKYYIYKDTRSQWRWRLNADNGRVIADSGESYYNRQDCLNAITLVKSSTSSPVYEI